MRKVLIIGAAVLSAACGGSRTGKGGTENAPLRDTARISAVVSDGTGRDTLDFGRLREGEVIEYSVALQNADTAAFVLLNVDTDCGCTTPDYDRKPLRPGETSRLTLRYDSRGQYGWQFKGIRIHTSLSEQPYVLYFVVDVTE